MHTDGKLDEVLPILYEVGININHPVEPESNDLLETKLKWAGRMAFIGNVHTPMLAYGRKEQIEEQVKAYCATVAPGGGYVLGSSTSIMGGILPENFVAMVQAVHKYGRYGSLGQASCLPAATQAKLPAPFLDPRSPAIGTHRRDSAPGCQEKREW
jgi:uroporphyrinogen-III decarboxylase